MSSTTYTPLNGQEVREVIKAHIAKLVDEIPLLRRGNTFHGALISVGVQLKAKPADVPVPKPQQFDMEFYSPGFEENPEAQRSVTEINNYVAALEQKKKEIEAELERYNVESFIVSDATAPDLVRLETNLPIPIEERTTTGRVENYKPANEVVFKKAN